MTSEEKLRKNNRILTSDRARVRFALWAVVALLVTGTVGFTLIERWSPFESLYMTVITLSTVGYMEVHPLSVAGRIFTMFLIFGGVSILAVAVSTLTSQFLESEMDWIFGERRMQQAIDRMEGHTIFCGFGRLARMSLSNLMSIKESLVVIDRDEVRTREAGAAGLRTVRGDASLESTLELAGIKRAARLVTLLPKDAENLYVILTAKELNPNLYIITRADDEASERRLQRAGANKIVSPYRMGGKRIADGLIRPYVTDFLDVAHAEVGEKQLVIEEIRILPNSAVVGRSLQGSELRQKTNIIIAAIISAAGKMEFNPSGDSVIEAGSTLIGLGLKSDFAKLEQMLLGESARS